MMRKRIIALIMFIGTIACAWAQNSIDALVEQYSTVGSSTFTSAVERDPKTRKVMKVVKVLEMSGVNYKKFISAFKKEASKGDFREKREEDSTTMILTTQNAKAHRIYMLKHDNINNAYSEMKITIIIKYKQT